MSDVLKTQDRLYLEMGLCCVTINFVYVVLFLLGNND